MRDTGLLIPTRQYDNLCVVYIMPSKHLACLLVLRNIGSTCAQRLYEIGIRSKDDIKRIGLLPIYQKIKPRHRTANVILLYALYGAMHDLKRNEIPIHVKQDLQRKAKEVDKTLDVKLKGELYKHL